MIRQISIIGTVCWQLASLPPTLAHELTHWLVSLPWADESAVIHDEQGFVHGVNWTDETPDWAIVLTSIAPLLLGSVVGLIGLWRLIAAPPGSPREWLVAGSLAGYWVIYVAPSGDDLNFQTGEGS